MRADTKKAPNGAFCLMQKDVAEWTGLEPATLDVTGRYSNQLNYHSDLSHQSRLSPTEDRYITCVFLFWQYVQVLFFPACRITQSDRFDFHFYIKGLTEIHPRCHEHIGSGPRIGCRILAVHAALS